jgi:Tol biopolymer transport system component
LSGDESPRTIEGVTDGPYIGWTPDGTAITYLRIEGNKVSLYMQPLNGGPPVRLIHFDEEPSKILAYSISPDGRKIAITRAKFNDSDVVMFSNFR